MESDACNSPACGAGGYRPTAEDRRREALFAAIQVLGRKEPSATEVIETAKLFEAYVVGDQATA